MKLNLTLARNGRSELFSPQGSVVAEREVRVASPRAFRDQRGDFLGLVAYNTTSFSSRLLYRVKKLSEVFDCVLAMLQCHLALCRTNTAGTYCLCGELVCMCYGEPVCLCACVLVNLCACMLVCLYAALVHLAQLTSSSDKENGKQRSNSLSFLLSCTFPIVCSHTFLQIK